MDDITKKPYTAWLEEALKTIIESDTEKMCFAAILPDGDVVTGYYNVDATDKAMLAHNIQADVTMDIIKANIDTIKKAMEDNDGDTV